MVTRGKAFENIQLCTCIAMRLERPALLFNVDCKFGWSFLATTAYHNFYRLGGLAFNQGE